MSGTPPDHAIHRENRMARPVLYAEGMRSADAKLRPMELTLEEWADLPDDERGELVDGRLEEEEVPSVPHEEVVAWLGFFFYGWFAPRGGLVPSFQNKYP